MTTIFQKTIGPLCQFLYPFEFRISQPAWPAQLRERLVKAVEVAARATADSARAAESAAKAQEEASKRPVNLSPAPDITVAVQERLRFLADVGTGLWRMRRNMVPAGTIRLLEARPMEEVRKPFRWLVSVWDALKENGLEIQDHTGDRYLSGQAIKVQAYDPAPELKEETVIDTIKPSIYLNGRMIQIGEVVVGTPDEPESQSPKPPTSSNAPQTSDPNKG